MVRSSEDIQNTWELFVANHKLEQKHKLTLHYIWLVKYVLQQMNLPNNTILGDEDFLSIGILGLSEAIDRFEPERGVKFESYAIPRIRGIIQDELRRLDWLSRSTRKKAHEYLQATDALRSAKGRDVSPEEIMLKLNITPDQYHAYLSAAAAAKASLSISEPSSQNSEDDYDVMAELPDTSQPDFLTSLADEERINFVTDYLSKLAEKKRVVMMLYYYEDLTFKDIGAVLNVSESRICQIHTQVVIDLRKKLAEYENA